MTESESLTNLSRHVFPVCRTCGLNRLRGGQKGADGSKMYDTTASNAPIFPLEICKGIETLVNSWSKLKVENRYAHARNRMI